MGSLFVYRGFSKFSCRPGYPFTPCHAVKRIKGQSRALSSSGLLFGFAALLAVTSACSSKRSPQEFESVSSFQVQGTVQKGPFAMGSRVRAVFAEARRGDERFPDHFDAVTTSSVGDFSLGLPRSGRVSLSATGRYYNEVLGRFSKKSITLRSHLVVSGTQSGVHINLVTELTYDRISRLMANRLSLEAARAQAEQELISTLGIGPEDFVGRNPGWQMNILGGFSQDNAYLFALSTVLAQAAQLRDPSDEGALSALVASIADDFGEDGILREVLKNKLKTAERQVDPKKVASNFAAYLSSLGISIELPDLNFMLDSDGDGVMNRINRCPVALYRPPKVCARGDPCPKRRCRDGRAPPCV